MVGAGGGAPLTDVVLLVVALVVRAVARYRGSSSVKLTSTDWKSFWRSDSA